MGALLLDKAMDQAGKAGAEYMWLGVWEQNAPARRFWRRMGFLEFGSHAFSFGSGEHTDLMMLRQLPASRDTSVSQVLRNQS
jgi:ribosomal protein S18 acetylase RimI-like enzyme